MKLCIAEGRMANMDMEMDKPSIIMRTFSKNQGVRSPAIVAILKENKGIFCCITKFSLIHNRTKTIEDTNHYFSTFFMCRWNNQILKNVKLKWKILNYLIIFN